MSTATGQRRSLLGLFADQPTPRLYDRIIALLRVRHDPPLSDRTEEAYVHWIRTVQELLGHKSVETTMIDTHVLNKQGRGVTSPLDSAQFTTGAGLEFRDRLRAGAGYPGPAPPAGRETTDDT